MFNSSRGIKRINNNQALCIDKHTLSGKAMLKIIVKISPVIQAKVVFLLPHKQLKTSNTIKDAGRAIIKEIHKLGMFLKINGMI